ncbi:MAG: hypothetical protein R3C17_17515 [Planctomycetaceae bacterium]
MRDALQSLVSLRAFSWLTNLERRVACFPDTKKHKKTQKYHPGGAMHYLSTTPIQPTTRDDLPPFHGGRVLKVFQNPILE